MKTILLTGATSALGDALARKLLEGGDSVIGTYHRNFPTQLSLFRNFTPLQVPFEDPRDLQSMPEQVDALIANAALNPPPMHSWEDFRKCNVEFSRILIEQCVQRGCNQFAYMSSMSVYGDIQTDLVREDTLPNNADPYGDSKLQAESLFSALLPKHSVMILRLPGIVGKGTQRNFLSTTLPKILTDQMISIANPDSQFNNLAHIEDLADLVSLFLEGKHQLRHSTYNCASSTSMRFEDLILKIYDILRKKPNYQIVAASKKPFRISVDRLMSDGFIPYTSEFALNKFVMDWCR